MKPNVKTCLPALACGALLALGGSSAAQGLDNKGDDFLFAFLPNFDAAITIELHLTSDVATDVTVEYPVNSPTFATTVGVAPGAVTIVTLPITTATSWVADTVANNVVHAFADDDFVAYMINRRAFSSDAALGLPTDTMNTDYIVIDYDPAFGPSEFAVFAEFDSTTVTITPTNDLLGGHPAGVPFVVNLDAGEGYLAQSAVASGAAGSLTGTLVESDIRVGVTNGSACPQVPFGVPFCDHIFEVAHPVQTWGQMVLVDNLANRPAGSIYRIVASADSTNVELDGAPLATLNKGEFFETGLLTGSHVIEADNAIFVCQYMPGSQSSGPGNGDPAMGNIIPCEQYQSDYTFSTVGGAQFTENFVSVFVQTTDIGSVLLDGVPIPAGSFTSIAGSSPPHSVALIAIADGTHTTSSPSPHGILVSGYNTDDSYLYPGGALFQFINPVGDENPPLCDILDDASQTFACGTATDNRPSEDTNGNGILDAGEDLNMNGLIDEDTGVFFVELKPGSMNITLTVDPFVPGDGIVTFKVNLIDINLAGSGTICITDGAGNVTACDVDLNGVPPCVTLDFETDDAGSPLTNGQDISTPPEFGVLVSISSGGPNLGAAIFDSSDPGPNSFSQDPDLLVGSGHVLILQTDDSPDQTVPGIFDRPNDDEDGGSVTFTFARASMPDSIDLIDIDDGSGETSFVLLTDTTGRMRVYAVPPRWTGDRLDDATSGIGTLDLTDTSPQPGFDSSAMATQDAGFDINAVISVEVQLGSSGAIDNLIWCPMPEPTRKHIDVDSAGGGFRPSGF